MDIESLFDLSANEREAEHIKRYLRSAEEIDRFCVDDSLSAVDRSIAILKRGTLQQRLSVISQLSLHVGLREPPPPAPSTALAQQPMYRAQTGADAQSSLIVQSTGHAMLVSSSMEKIWPLIATHLHAGGSIDDLAAANGGSSSSSTSSSGTSGGGNSASSGSGLVSSLTPSGSSTIITNLLSSNSGSAALTVSMTLEERWLCACAVREMIDNAAMGWWWSNTATPSVTKASSAGILGSTSSISGGLRNSFSLSSSTSSSFSSSTSSSQTTSSSATGGAVAAGYATSAASLLYPRVTSALLKGLLKSSINSSIDSPTADALDSTETSASLLSRGLDPPSPTIHPAASGGGAGSLSGSNTAATASAHHSALVSMSASVLAAISRAIIACIRRGVFPLEALRTEVVPGAFSLATNFSRPSCERIVGATILAAVVEWGGESGWASFLSSTTAARIVRSSMSAASLTSPSSLSASFLLSQPASSSSATDSHAGAAPAVLDGKEEASTVGLTALVALFQDLDPLVRSHMASLLPVMLRRTAWSMAAAELPQAGSSGRRSSDATTPVNDSSLSASSSMSVKRKRLLEASIDGSRVALGRVLFFELLELLNDEDSLVRSSAFQSASYLLDSSIITCVPISVKWRYLIPTFEMVLRRGVEILGSSGASRAALSVLCSRSVDKEATASSSSIASNNATSVHLPFSGLYLIKQDSTSTSHFSASNIAAPTPHAQGHSQISGGLSASSKGSVPAPATPSLSSFSNAASGSAVSVPSGDSSSFYSYPGLASDVPASSEEYDASPPLHSGEKNPANSSSAAVDGYASSIGASPAPAATTSTHSQQRFDEKSGKFVASILGKFFFLASKQGDMCSSKGGSLPSLSSSSATLDEFSGMMLAMKPPHASTPFSFLRASLEYLFVLGHHPSSVECRLGAARALPAAFASLFGMLTAATVEEAVERHQSHSRRVEHPTDGSSCSNTTSSTIAPEDSASSSKFSTDWDSRWLLPATWGLLGVSTSSSRASGVTTHHSGGGTAMSAGVHHHTPGTSSSAVPNQTLYSSASTHSLSAASVGASRSSRNFGLGASSLFPPASVSSTNHFLLPPLPRKVSSRLVLSYDDSNPQSHHHGSVETTTSSSSPPAYVHDAFRPDDVLFSSSIPSIQQLNALIAPLLPNASSIKVPSAAVHVSPSPPPPPPQSLILASLIRHYLLPTLSALAGDDAVSVRLCVASGLPHLACMLGHARAPRLLTQVCYSLLLDGNDEIVKCLVESSSAWIPSLCAWDGVLRAQTYAVLVPALLGSFSRPRIATSWRIQSAFITAARLLSVLYPLPQVGEACLSILHACSVEGSTALGRRAAIQAVVWYARHGATGRLRSMAIQYIQGRIVGGTAERIREKLASFLPALVPTMVSLPSNKQQLAAYHKIPLLSRTEVLNALASITLPPPTSLSSPSFVSAAAASLQVSLLYASSAPTTTTSLGTSASVSSSSSSSHGGSTHSAHYVPPHQQASLSAAPNFPQEVSRTHSKKVRGPSGSASSVLSSAQTAPGIIAPPPASVYPGESFKTTFLGAVERRLYVIDAAAAACWLFSRRILIETYIPPLLEAAASDPSPLVRIAAIQSLPYVRMWLRLPDDMEPVAAIVSLAKRVAKGSSSVSSSDSEQNPRVIAAAHDAVSLLNKCDTAVATMLSNIEKPRRLQKLTGHGAATVCSAAYFAASKGRPASFDANKTSSSSNSSGYQPLSIPSLPLAHIFAPYYAHEADPSLNGGKDAPSSESAVVAGGVYASVPGKSRLSLGAAPGSIHASASSGTISGGLLSGAVTSPSSMSTLRRGPSGSKLRSTSIGTASAVNVLASGGGLGTVNDAAQVTIGDDVLPVSDDSDSEEDDDDNSDSDSEHPVRAFSNKSSNSFFSVSSSSADIHAMPPRARAAIICDEYGVSVSSSPLVSIQGEGGGGREDKSASSSSIPLSSPSSDTPSLSSGIKDQMHVADAAHLLVIITTVSSSSLARLFHNKLQSGELAISTASVEDVRVELLSIAAAAHLHEFLEPHLDLQSLSAAGSKENANASRLLSFMRNPFSSSYSSNPPPLVPTHAVSPLSLYPFLASDVHGGGYSAAPSASNSPQLNTLPPLMSLAGLVGMQSSLWSSRGSWTHNMLWNTAPPSASGGGALDSSTTGGSAKALLKVDNTSSDTFALPSASLKASPSSNSSSAVAASDSSISSMQRFLVSSLPKYGSRAPSLFPKSSAAPWRAKTADAGSSVGTRRTGEAAFVSPTCKTLSDMLQLSADVAQLRLYSNQVRPVVEGEMGDLLRSSSGIGNSPLMPPQPHSKLEAGGAEEGLHADVRKAARYFSEYPLSGFHHVQSTSCDFSLPTVDHGSLLDASHTPTNPVLRKSSPFLESGFLITCSSRWSESMSWCAKQSLRSDGSSSSIATLSSAIGSSRVHPIECILPFPHAKMTELAMQHVEKKLSLASKMERREVAASIASSSSNHRLARDRDRAEREARIFDSVEHCSAATEAASSLAMHDAGPILVHLGASAETLGEDFSSSYTATNALAAFLSWTTNASPHFQPMESVPVSSLIQYDASRGSPLEADHGTQRKKDSVRACVSGNSYLWPLPGMLSLQQALGVSVVIGPTLFSPVTLSDKNVSFAHHVLHSSDSIASLASTTSVSLTHPCNVAYCTSLLTPVKLKQSMEGSLHSSSDPFIRKHLASGRFSDFSTMPCFPSKVTSLSSSLSSNLTSFLANFCSVSGGLGPRVGLNVESASSSYLSRLQPASVAFTLSVAGQASPSLTLSLLRHFSPDAEHVLEVPPPNEGDTSIASSSHQSTLHHHQHPAALSSGGGAAGAPPLVSSNLSASLLMMIPAKTSSQVPMPLPSVSLQAQSQAVGQKTAAPLQLLRPSNAVTTEPSSLLRSSNVQLFAPSRSPAMFSIASAASPPPTAASPTTSSSLVSPATSSTSPVLARSQRGSLTRVETTSQRGIGQARLSLSGISPGGLTSGTLGGLLSSPLFLTPENGLGEKEASSVARQHNPSSPASPSTALSTSPSSSSRSRLLTSSSIPSGGTPSPPNLSRASMTGARIVGISSSSGSVTGGGGAASPNFHQSSGSQSIGTLLQSVSPSSPVLPAPSSGGISLTPHRLARTSVSASKLVDEKLVPTIHPVQRRQSSNAAMAGSAIGLTSNSSAAAPATLSTQGASVASTAAGGVGSVRVSRLSLTTGASIVGHEASVNRKK